MFSFATTLRASFSAKPKPENETVNNTSMFNPKQKLLNTFNILNQRFWKSWFSYCGWHQFNFGAYVKQNAKFTRESKVASLNPKSEAARVKVKPEYDAQQHDNNNNNSNENNSSDHNNINTKSNIQSHLTRPIAASNWPNWFWNKHFHSAYSSKHTILVQRIFFLGLPLWMVFFLTTTSSFGAHNSTSNTLALILNVALWI